MNGYGTEYEYDEQMWLYDEGATETCEHVNCNCSPWYCGCNALPDGVHDCTEHGLPHDYCGCER